MEAVKRFGIMEVVLLIVLCAGLLLLRQQPEEDWAGVFAAREKLVCVLDFIASEQPHK